MSGPIISPDWVGRIIDGRFALHEFLGESPTSCVFRTELPQAVAKRAAIKLIAAEGARADAYLSNWAKAANLSHPNLLQVFRSGRFQFGSIQLVYVVTQFAEEVLSQILPQRALAPDETREMLGPVIDALAYLHGKGFVHGHVKPSNILVVEDQVKLSGDDLAASGVRNQFNPVTIYDAPEVSTGTITPAADVWSVGMLLTETLTQRTASWDRNSTREPVLPEGLPRAFAEVVRGCLRRDAESRIALNEIQGRLTPNHPIAFPASRPEKTAPAAIDPRPSEKLMEAVEMSGPRPTKMRLLPMVSVLAVVLILFALFMMRSRPKQEQTSVQAPTASTTEPTPVGKAPSGNTPETTSSREAAAPAAVARSGDGVVERKMPEVSSQARGTIHGTVTVAVRADVGSDGRVADASFQSEGPSRYFARVAMEAARGWKFTPAQTPSHWVIRFKFRRSGDEATASEATR